MVMKPKNLKREHKEFLANQGYKTKNFLLDYEDMDTYRFINIITHKQLVFRR